ncbi:MAG: polymerase sigma factor [Candidatus Saccharibacteria bacterium]|nr:polymerase sigma factor [Candidatus Saccharibacteria bacterium]
MNMQPAGAEAQIYFDAEPAHQSSPSTPERANLGVVPTAVHLGANVVAETVEAIVKPEAPAFSERAIKQTRTLVQKAAGIELPADTDVVRLQAFAEHLIAVRVAIQDLSPHPGTGRIKELLSLYVAGVRNKDIAEQLSMSVNTASAGVTRLGTALGRYGILDTMIARAFTQYNDDPTTDLDALLPIPKQAVTATRRAKSDVQGRHLGGVDEPTSADLAEETAFEKAAAEVDPYEEQVVVTDSVKAYLREIGRVPLLTAVEEVELSMKIEAGLWAAQLLTDPTYAAMAKKYVPADLEIIAKEGEKARKHLIEANLRLGVNLAKRYQGRGLHLLDLFQESNLGLMRAAEKFDYAKGYKFSTYATWWVRQALQRAIADKGKTIRTPVHMSEVITKVTRVRGELRQELGREPTHEEIGNELDMEPTAVKNAIDYGRPTLSLEQPVGSSNEQSDAVLGDFIVDDDGAGSDPEQAAQSVNRVKALSDAVNSLAKEGGYNSERGAKVLRMRFGLDTGVPMTLDEIGQSLRLTRERVRQIEGDFIRLLRSPKYEHLKELL